MKRIIYSNIIKGIALVLFIVSIALCALAVSNGIAEYTSEKVSVYGFENDFSEARFFSHMLDAPESALFNAYSDFYGETAQNSTQIAEEKTLESRIEERLNEIYCLEQINYYIKWNGKVFTNCGATDEKELMQSRFFSYARRDDRGRTERTRSQMVNYPHMLEQIYEYDEKSVIAVCTSIKENYADECNIIWRKQESIVKDNAFFTGLFAAFALLMLIYLICVCGRGKDCEYKAIRIDSVWAEVHLALIGGAILGAAGLCAILMDEYSAGRFPLDLLNIIVALSSAAASVVVLNSFLSIIRNIKSRRFMRSSIVFQIVRWCAVTLVRGAKWLCGKLKSFGSTVVCALSEKTGAILISMLFVYTAIITVCCLFAFLNFILFVLWILIGFSVFGFACFVVSYRAKDIDEIRKGVTQIRNGNLAYKIPEPKSGDMKSLAKNVNDIAKGLDESVAAKLKAERLKTELITNISHDLKTPLTSIINYTALLENEEGLSEEARDYIRIISAKSDRLKMLTSDLFDISKVQSGNEEIVLEKIDVALLINQSLGEHDGEIAKSGLPFCVNTGKELYISADGKKMSRVVSNLIGNILKYTLKNTRVFITAFERDSEIVMEFKNIASYPMDFDTEEITGRFVRGDESRTAEGNGLGLAIAKSYTEACGGKFKIIIDGDMFKAIITFERLE